MKLRHVVKVTGQVLQNELKVSKNFKNQNCIFEYLVIEVSDYSVVRVNITINEFASSGKKDTRYDAMIKALTFKSKASYGNDADRVQVTSGFLQTKSKENKQGIRIDNIEVRTNFINITEDSKVNQSQFELEGFLDRIENNVAVIKQLNYNNDIEEFKLTADKEIIIKLKDRVGSIVLIKGKVDKSVNVIKNGEYLVATSPAIERFHIEEQYGSINNSEENISCFINDL